MLTRPSTSVSCSQRPAAPRQESGSGGASLEVGPPSTSCQGTRGLSPGSDGTAKSRGLFPYFPVFMELVLLVSLTECVCGGLGDSRSLLQGAKVLKPQLPCLRMGMPHPSCRVLKTINDHLRKAPSTGPEPSGCPLK